MNGLFFILAAALAQAENGAVPGAESSTRPEWIGRQSWSESPTRFRVVTSELWATPEEALDDAMDRAGPAARDFAAEADARIKSSWQVPAHILHDGLVRQEYVEKVDWTYGPMYRAHLLLELSPAKREILLNDWRQVLLHRRLGQLGAGLSFVLVCLTTTLGYLRLDDATRGYYTGWLRAGLITILAGSAGVLYSWFV